jgi:hypothetical protein
MAIQNYGRPGREPERPASKKSLNQAHPIISRPFLPRKFHAVDRLIARALAYALLGRDCSAVLAQARLFAELAGQGGIN